MYGLMLQKRQRKKKRNKQCNQRVRFVTTLRVRRERLRKRRSVGARRPNQQNCLTTCPNTFLKCPIDCPGFYPYPKKPHQIITFCISMKRKVLLCKLSKAPNPAKRLLRLQQAKIYLTSENRDVIWRLYDANARKHIGIRWLR